MRSLPLLAILLASTSLLAQDSGSVDAPRKIRLCTGKKPEQPCIIPPISISTPEPDYSNEAREKGLEGNIVLILVVGVDGRVHDLHVTKSLGAGLDEKAIEAVKRWTFTPGKLDEKPVAVKINVEVAFQLLKKK